MVFLICRKNDINLYTKLDLYINLCHSFFGGADVKKRDVEKHLKDLGWWLLREGGNHEVWTNGKETIALPRHNEINERLAKAIIKGAKKVKQG